MKVDLRYALNEGMNNLSTWRNTYSKLEYPEKIAINVFYRKHTIGFMFSEILGCFEKSFFGKQKVKWNDFNEGFELLKHSYSKNAISKIQPILKELLTSPQRVVGDTMYQNFMPLISSAQSGNMSKLEELEHTYMYYLLTDEAILLWGALGGTGLSKVDAIGKMSGVVLKIDDIRTYGQIEQILGHLCVAPYLHNHYKALPPNV